MNKRGKITISVLIGLIVLISLSSLYFVLATPSDNIKIYDPETKTITIKNGVTEVAKIKLNTPIVHQVIRGKDRLVAEFTIENFADSSNVFKNMEFYDIKNNMNKFDRPFTYKYKTYNSEEVPDYEKVCKERVSGNGSTEKYDCYINQVGSHIRKEVIWNDFNENSDLPAGEITFGVFTDVLPNERVEWIPTLFNVRIEEWAEWTESLNVGLNHYWAMEENTGTNVEDVRGRDIGQQKNGTLLPNAVWTTGKLGYALNSTTSGGFNTPGYLSSELGNVTFSISIWVYKNGTGNQYLLGSQATPNQNRFAMYSAADTRCAWVLGNGATLYIDGCTSFETWTHYILMNNASGQYVYKNGILNGSASSKTPTNAWWNMSWGGGAAEVTPGVEGIIDEIGIWNRSLSDSEISDLYNNGSGITYTSVFDTILPNTTKPIVNSTDGTNRSNQDLNCHATLTDDMQTNLTAYWRWYKNNESNLSGNKIVTNGTYSLITTLDSGNTTKGENWICEVKPFDGYNNGTAKNSSAITILNSVPTHTTPLLETLSKKNLSTEDLFCYNQTTYDADRDNVINIYNWYNNSQSFLSLNLPFEINADDYSSNDNHGNISGAVSIDGKVGNALSFDGVDDTVTILDDDTLDFINKKTWEIWFNRSSIGTETLFDKGNSTTTNYKLEFLSNDILKFSYSIIPGTFYYQWLTNTQVEFDQGTYDQTLFDTTANILTLNTTSIEQQIFSDGFESGDFAANNWITYADTVNWSVSIASPSEGTYHTEIIDTGGVGDRSTLEVSISTVGFTNINISYDVQRIGLDAADNFTAEYFNGTDYIIIESNSSVDDLEYQNRSFLLSSDAENNQNFKLRFSCVGAGPSEGCRIDNVELRGNGTGFINSGEYTSKVFDSNGLSEWINLTWSEQLTAETDIIFQIRSCDDSLCLGETFVGPDNTSNTNFTDSTFNDISFIQDNQYFQFKGFLSTTNFSISPNLSQVSVDYSQTISDSEINITSTTAITDNEWHLVTVTYDTNNNLSLYINNTLEASKIETSLPNYKDNNLTIGQGFNGTIDEFRIYENALSQEQVTNNFNLDYNKIVSEETAGGDVWMCQVTPNDGDGDGDMLNSTSLDVYWNITFNVTSGEDQSQISNFNIDCDNGFSVSGADSPFTTGFEPGTYVCIFSKEGFYDRTKIFTADIDKIVNVKLSWKFSLTIEEHTWLEAIYNCIILQDCSLYNLLLEINQTVGNIWEHTKPTDETVITFENVTNKVVNVTSNLSIDYTVNIPVKAGYGTGDYLPVRIGYWFLDVANTTCYNQGDKPTGVEDPYCQPLVIETIGPMGGSVSFTVEMRPELPAGDYSIKRMIDIDPNNVWINYGQETIGTILLTESLSDSGISLEKTGESMPSSEAGSPADSSGRGGGGTTTIIKEKEIIKVVSQGDEETEDKEQGAEETEVSEEENSGSSWITGGVIGTNLLSGGSIVIIVAILCGTFIIFMIVRNKTILKKKK